MPTDLEEKIRTSLERQVQHVDAHDETAFAAVFVGVKRGATRRRRARIASVSCVALLAVGAVGVVVQVQDRRPSPTATSSTEDFRLVPSWTPEGMTFARQDLVRSQEGFAHTTVWRDGDRMVILSVNAERPGCCQPRALEQALIDRQVDGNQYISWSDASTEFALWARPALPGDEIKRFASSVRFDAATRALTFDGPIGDLREVFRGESKELQSLQAWSLSGGSLYLSAELPSATARRIFPTGPNSLNGQVKQVEARGVPGYVTVSKEGASLSWTEGSWRFLVSGLDEATVVKFANGLRPATMQEWDEFPSLNTGAAPTPEDRRKPAAVAATIETDQGEVRLRAGDLVTEEGCVRVVIEGLDKEVKECIKPGSQTVPWSTVAKVKGKKVVVAIVDLTVDAVRLTGEPGEPSPEVISSLTIDDVIPAGFVFDTSEHNSRWLGFVVLPFDGDQPGRIEAYTSAEFDREAPSMTLPDDQSPEAEGQVPTPAEPGAEAELVDELDLPLKSIGRFPIG